MISKTLLKEAKRIFLYALSIFLILSFSYLSISVFIQTNADEVHKVELINSEQRLAQVENSIISNKITSLVSDLLYVSDSLKLNEAADNDYANIEKQWLAFSNRKKIYDQIRFIDTEGNEVIRVNYDENGAYVVDKEDLQNKKDRYYFTNTISLDKNKVYISELDLNTENGTVEQPIKPTIRLSVPYYGTDEKLDGIVVLNYSASDMLNQIRKIASTSQGSIFILNTNGYWLFNSFNSAKEWSFMYEDRMDESFTNEFNDEWETIKTNKKGSLITQNGVFNYTDVLANNEFSFDSCQYSLELGFGDWYIISYISPYSDDGMLFENNILKTTSLILDKDYFVYILILFVSFLVSVLVTANKIERNKTKYFSEFDTMTGVYNRRAGFEKLNQLYNNIAKTNCLISICFIDINGLKEVNDNLGHTAGDELIISVTSVIKKNIREHDIVVRLGGDEFLIIFEGMDEEDTEKVWDRIVNEYEHINNTENRKYLISVSHGIEILKCDSKKYVDETINQADEKMYIEKREIKKDLKVIKD